MAFRQTAFDPSVSAQVARQGPGITGMAATTSTVDMNRMEEALARQLANQKITDERRKREIEKLCGESDELRELQAKIKAAYLNKERSQQMTEKQYRVQTEIVSEITIANNWFNLFYFSLLVGARRPDRYHHAQEQGDWRLERESQEPGEAGGPAGEQALNPAIDRRCQHCAPVGPRGVPQREGAGRCRRSAHDRGRQRTEPHCPAKEGAKPG